MSFSHWEYFQSIEKDFVLETRNIGYQSNYYAVRSNALGEIVLACGSGFLTTLGLLCKSIDPEKSPKTLQEFYPILVTKYPRFTNYRIIIPSYNMALSPWQEWDNGKVPQWWEGYHALKKNFEENFKEANYWNALYATAGLLCGILYYHKEIHGRTTGINKNMVPQVMQPKVYVCHERRVQGWSYSTPDDAGS